MKDLIKSFLVIITSFIVMLIVVYKPYREEVVDLDLFVEHYSTTDSLEEGGGIEIISDNFLTIEKEYKIGVGIIDETKLAQIDLEKKYTIPTLEKYTVASGDTLSEIATKFGISLEVLKANNPGISSSLKVGQTLNIVKENGVFYKVKRGDSLFKIALTYKVDVDDLRKYNSLSNDNIIIGQELFIHNPSDESLKRLASGGSVNNSKSFRMPVKYAGVTSPYGSRFHPVLKRYIHHAGVDLRARYVPLMASKSGTVTFAGYMNGYGNLIKIDHGNGYETRSAHLNKMYVKKGQKVSAGDVIGQTGMSGRVTGPHLHFEIRKNGKTYDPMKYLIK